jgi:hypothetical protein
MNDELEKDLEESVNVLIEAPSCNILEGSEETQENLTHDSRCPIRDFNQEIPEYVLRVLPLCPTAPY